MLVKTISTLPPLSKGSECKTSLQSRCISSTWPSNTRVHCWNCCHQFSNVPAFLPVSRDRASGVFHLSGLFCSWNCAKAYRYSHPNFCHKDTAPFLPVFAFLTSHRPRYCPTPLTKMHPYNCRCLDYSHRLQFPPPKENLKMFGGTMTIDEYRQGFMTIDTIEWIMRCFLSQQQFPDQIGVLAQLRNYQYDFLPIEDDTKTIPIIQEGEAENKQETEPEVMIEGIDESFFY
jgi:hypothetical protein